MQNSQRTVQKFANKHQQHALRSNGAILDILRLQMLLQVFLTAYLELVMLGGLSKGQSVLIHAGASGVG